MQLNEFVRCRLSLNDRQLIEDAARKRGVSISEFMRQSATAQAKRVAA